MSGVLVVTGSLGPAARVRHSPRHGGRDDELQGAEQDRRSTRATPKHEAPVRLTGEVGLGHDPMWAAARSRSGKSTIHGRCSGSDSGRHSR